MKFGIIVFPGSNCDHDNFNLIKGPLRQSVRFIWHKETSLPQLDAIIVPGGFSYGDYLRCGAIARFSPIMEEVVRFAKKGGLVLGICNGFQVLTEAGLLPGALMRNKDLRFICDTVPLKVCNNESPFTRHYTLDTVVHMPIAHGEGSYQADEATLKSLNDHGQIVFRYHENNPNGSMESIAGICNKKGNVLGMMPHPERCSEEILGNCDGLKLFESMIG